jgi:transposase
VEAIAMDMWKPYVQSTLAHVPGAAGKIVHDPCYGVVRQGEQQLLISISHYL